ncbi:hypothetical protein DB30_00991 [Enhygromyxa salina]|uniref:DUF6484 domain-containing protein n=1 Tax=Enhygromyxa salina TaxID=215803 RepID=A0A0C1ZP84_9BACT|nr:DUF6484 domain-containing protein [Enhygromyxa salina]KIG12828.1 hypothetical protein DB30_00991 [Enhygromyxa salina]
MPNDKVTTSLERSHGVEFHRALDSAVCVGCLVVEDGVALVNFPGNSRGPMPARWLAQIDVQALLSTAPPGHELLLVFEGGRCELPVVVGVLAPVELNPALDAQADELSVDGRRIELEADDELVLRCGKASLTLRRNGRVVLRGVQVETRASGRTRITGATVEIN